MAQGLDGQYEDLDFHSVSGGKPLERFEHRCDTTCPVLGGKFWHLC